MSEIDKMLRFLHLDGPAADVLRELAVFRTVPRRTQLTEPDSDHHLVSFMVSGLLRGYLLDDRGGEITECFSFQYGDLRINSLDWERGHLDQYVETLEETAFVSFDLDELMPHILSYPELTAIFVRRISEAYAEQSCYRRILVHTSAAERYQWFLDSYPGLIDRAPHKCIASFLNMTPVPLSRLRRAEREGDFSTAQ